MEIEWSKPAREQLDKALDFILEKGYIDYTFELNESILLRIESLAKNHNTYPFDRYKKIITVIITRSKLMNTAYHTG